MQFLSRSNGRVLVVHPLEDQVEVKSFSPIAGNEPQAEISLEFFLFKTCEEKYTHFTGELSENNSRLDYETSL
jgi:hypothetical protein